MMFKRADSHCFFFSFFLPEQVLANDAPNKVKGETIDDIMTHTNIWQTIYHR